MPRVLALVLVAASLAGCGIARTAYNRDHSKSWMCVPNSHVQEPPLGNHTPLTIDEPAQMSGTP